MRENETKENPSLFHKVSVNDLEGQDQKVNVLRETGGKNVERLMRFVCERKELLAVE